MAQDLSKIQLSSGPGWAGFSGYNFPGKSAMEYLWENTNLFWVGVYLNHQWDGGGKDPTWIDNYSYVVDPNNWGGQHHWGTLIIYLPHHTDDPKQGAIVDKDPVGVGQNDADYATQLAFYAQIPFQKVIYLDWESGNPLTDKQKQYASSWCKRILANGYYAGVYCHGNLASTFATLGEITRIWAISVTWDRSPVDNNNKPNPKGIAWMNYLAEAVILPEFDPNSAVGAAGRNYDIFAWQHTVEVTYSPPQSGISLGGSDFAVAATWDPSDLDAGYAFQPLQSTDATATIA